jgi:excinuclease ABC subunit C
VSEQTPGFTFDPGLYSESGGCFMMRDGSGRALYAGKTANLRRRLASYFKCENDKSPGKKSPASGPGNRLDKWLPRLTARVQSIEIFPLASEVARIRLVNELIERWQPLFNLATFLDPGGTGYIVLTGEVFPRFLSLHQEQLHRTVQNNTLSINRQFGPFPPGGARPIILNFINETFLLRTCHPLPRKVCFDYQLKICSGPCEGFISLEVYQQKVDQAADLLSTLPEKLIDSMREQMLSASDNLEFEKAQHLRDKIQVLEDVFNKQSSLL